MRAKASGESALLLLDAIQILRSAELRRGGAAEPASAVLTLRDHFENRVDLLVGIRGFDPKAFSRTIEVALEGESLKFVGLEDFVAMKLFARGPQDLVDTKGALEVASEPPNMELLRELAQRYGPETVRSLESIQSNFSRDIDSGLDLD